MVHRCETLGYYLKNCAELEIVRKYEDATMAYFTLERKLLHALQRRDRASVRSLKPKVDWAWKIRTTLRAAIRLHEMRKSMTAS